MKKNRRSRPMLVDVPAFWQGKKIGKAQIEKDLVIEGQVLFVTAVLLPGSGNEVEETNWEKDDTVSGTIRDGALYLEYTQGK